MEFTDQVLKCVDCGEEFVFSAGEQLFFRDKGFIHQPRHCKKCKGKLTNGRGRVDTRSPAPSAGLPPLFHSCHISAGRSCVGRVFSGKVNRLSMLLGTDDNPPRNWWKGSCRFGRILLKVLGRGTAHSMVEEMGNHPLPGFAKSLEPVLMIHEVRHKLAQGTLPPDTCRKHDRGNAK